MRQKFAALVASVGLLGAATVHAQPTPDLSAYNCQHISDGTAGLTSRHVAQVIAGTFTEWREYLSQDTPARLVCIVQLRPRSLELSAAAAAAFLQASAAIGAPAPTQARKSLESSEAAPADDGPIKPMPLHHKTADTAPTGERSRAFDPNDMAPVMHRLDSVATSPSSASQPAKSQSAAAPSGLERQQTVGVDDRTRVSTTTSNTYPYNTLGYLQVTFPSGNSFRCSATAVSAYVVLTAGHCVHNNTEGGYITKVSFTPAQNEATFFGSILRPNGTKRDAVNILTTQRWTQISGPSSLPTTDYQYDLGAIQFATPFTYTSTFMPVVFNDGANLADTAGYPGTVQNTSSNGMWEMSGSQISTSFLRSQGVKAYAIDATGGQSGSPFWETDSLGRHTLMGQLSYGDDLDDDAGGPWYYSGNQDLLTSWIAFTPTGTAVAGNTVSGLRVPAIFDSSQSTTQSFLRFYNTGGTAGTVDVTLATYDDGQLLATWTSPPIPPNASMQFSIVTIENGAVGGTIVKRGYYAASIRPHFSGYFQHVLWRPADGTITNATACDTHVTEDSTTLMNVHSSILTAYPESVVVQNTSGNSASVTLGIYDAATGSRIGGYNTGSIPANGEVIRSVRTMENSAGISPTATQYHYNFKVETGFTGTLQALVTNSNAGVITDMSSFCALVAQ